MGTRKIGIGIASLALAGMLAACGSAGTGGAGGNIPTSSGTFGTEVIEQDGAVKLTAKEAEEGSSAIGATIKIKEGELLAISPDLDKGAVKVRLNATTEGGSASSQATLDESVSGRVHNTYAVAPGEYTVGFSVDGKDKVTGSLLVSPIDADEYKKQNESLEKTVSEADAATGGAASKAIGETIDKANEVVEQVAEKAAGTDASKDASKG